jgi:hypothetical protein
MDRPPARMTVTPTVYHETPDGQGVSVGTGFSRLLCCDADPDRVRMRLSESWQPLDLGRVPDVGFAYLEHEAPRLQLQPTQSERHFLASQVVEVSFRGDGVADLLLPAGESTHFSPADAARVKVRVNRGVARLTVALIPR